MSFGENKTVAVLLFGWKPTLETVNNSLSMINFTSVFSTSIIFNKETEPLVIFSFSKRSSSLPKLNLVSYNFLLISIKFALFVNGKITK